MSSSAKTNSKADDIKLEQLSVRILPQTREVITKTSKLLGINSDALMARLIIEASTQIITDESAKPKLPPIMAAARGAMQNNLPTLE